MAGSRLNESHELDLSHFFRYVQYNISSMQSLSCMRTFQQTKVTPKLTFVIAAIAQYWLKSIHKCQYLKSKKQNNIMKVLLFGPILILALSFASLAVTAEKSDDEIFLWSSTGGGWRAMFACVGYVNLFRQAGLFTEDSSLFDAIVSTFRHSSNETEVKTQYWPTLFLLLVSYFNFRPPTVALAGSRHSYFIPRHFMNRRSSPKPQKTCTPLPSNG